MSKSVTFVVQTFLDYPRPGAEMKLPNTWLLSPHWVKARIRFYHELTLRSILNQSFQDFRIVVLCGSRYKEITKNTAWHERVEVCYDSGEALNDSIDTDYLSITRIDSDDLMHKDVMAEVSQNLILTDKRECLIYDKCLLWIMPHRYISRHYRASPPTFTHIFPKSIYKNFSRYHSEHFLSHGRSGGKLPTTKRLSAHKYCIVKHWLGNYRLRHGMKLTTISDAKRQELADKYPFVFIDKEEIKEILKDFAVTDKWIR